MAYDDNKERQEAIFAGMRAKNSLTNALNALNSARGWGIYDILGGGVISTFIKHSKMDDASDYLEEAHRDLQIFNKELSDIKGLDGINLSTNDVWGVSDWLFDSFLTDWIVQGRINEAREQIRHAIDQVDSILANLR